jgi:D-glycero-D-manno-heptose 1,7-bisphosphate phosphatase
MIVDDGGLWCRIESTGLASRPALFLDRDGVIIADTHYLGQAGDMRVLEGAALAIARCNARKIPVVVVTNQSGIARGYYDWDGFRAVQAALSGALAAAGAHLDAVLACAYHADGRGRLRVAGHPWRKPAPGMILEAARRTGIDLAKSWIIGDRVHDLAAGSAAGLAGGTLVGPGDRDGLNAGSLAGGHFVVATAPSLADAVDALMMQGHFSRPA